jgi:hypothetical protein
MARILQRHFLGVMAVAGIVHRDYPEAFGESENMAVHGRARARTLEHADQR